MALHGHTPRQRAAIAGGSGPKLPRKQRATGGSRSDPPDDDVLADFIARQIDFGATINQIAGIIGLTPAEVRAILKSIKGRSK